MLVLRAAKVRKSFISRCVFPDLFPPVNCDHHQQGKHQKSLELGRMRMRMRMGIPGRTKAPPSALCKESCKTGRIKESAERVCRAISRIYLSAGIDKRQVGSSEMSEGRRDRVEEDWMPSG